MDEKLKKLSTGTTTVGLIFKDGVVLAADTMSAMGYTVSNEECQKIIKITDKIALTTAGNAGDTITIARFLKSHANLYSIDRNTDMTVSAAMTYLSNILNNSRFAPYFVWMIVGGFNDKPELYSTDYVGGFEPFKYTSNGAGMDLAISALDSTYKEGMAENDAVKVAIKAIESAKKRNIATGGKYAKVVVITKDAYKELSEDEVKRLMAEEKAAVKK